MLLVKLTSAYESSEIESFQKWYHPLAKAFVAKFTGGLTVHGL
jgi:hypothetical protein